MFHELIESSVTLLTTLLALPFAVAGTLAAIAGTAEAAALVLRPRKLFPH